MKFDVYCDEAYPDLLTSESPQCPYIVIGGLWLPTEIREELKATVHEVRDYFKVGPEFKWHKVSNNKYEFYEQLMELFFAFGEHLSFRCIVVEASKVNVEKYHDGDKELGFYAFYFHMLSRWIFSGNEYSIFCDYKRNRLPTRFRTLGTRLSEKNAKATIHQVQTVLSSESVLIQMVDVLVGATSAKLNDRLTPESAKHRLVAYIEKQLGKPIAPTYLYERKFNVFKIRL